MKFSFKKKNNYTALKDPETETQEYNTNYCSVCYLRNNIKTNWAGWNRESKRLLCKNCVENFEHDLLKKNFIKKTRIIRFMSCGFCKTIADCYIINCCKHCRPDFS